MTDKKLINKAHETLAFGVLLAIVGGLLDAYTFVGRGGVFANAQTGNIVLLGVYASKKDWNQVLIYTAPIVAFIVGVIVAEWIKNNSSRYLILDWKREVLILEMIVLFIIGFLPASTSNFIVTVTISFVASVQVSSFRKLKDTPYNTTMCTGNLRTASQAAYIAITKKDKNSRTIALHFLIIIVSFLIGALLGGIFTLRLGGKAVWGAVILLALAVLLLNIYEKQGIAYVEK
ncbi:MAG: YoaK family protein [Solirubrobacterales bacterium]